MSQPPDSAGSAGPALFMTQLSVADWPVQVRWYVETLGLPLLMRDDADGFALLGTGRGKLALKRNRAVDEQESGRVRLVFQVRDIDAERARLLNSGVEVGEPAENLREGYREIRLSDPEGTPITLFSWTAQNTRQPQAFS